MSSKPYDNHNIDNNVLSILDTKILSSILIIVAHNIVILLNPINNVCCCGYHGELFKAVKV